MSVTPLEIWLPATAGRWARNNAPFLKLLCYMWWIVEFRATLGGWCDPTTTATPSSPTSTTSTTSASTTWPMELWKCRYWVSGFRNVPWLRLYLYTPLIFFHVVTLIPLTWIFCPTFSVYSGLYFVICVVDHLCYNHIGFCLIYRCMAIQIFWFVLILYVFFMLNLGKG